MKNITYNCVFSEKQKIKAREIQEKKRAYRETINHTNRRQFLEFATKSGFSLPLLKTSGLIAGIASSRFALAQNNYTNNKAVFSYVSQGCPDGQWLNNGPVSDFYREYGVDDLCRFREVDCVISPRASGRQALGDISDSLGSQKDTYDRRIAQAMKNTTPIDLCYLGAQAYGGVNTGHQEELMFISGTANSNPTAIPIDGAANALEAYFGQPTINNNPPINHILTEHQAQIKQMKSRLSHEEFSFLDRHLDAIEKQQIKIQDDTEQKTSEILEQCSPPSLNDNLTHIRDEGMACADVLVSALACGLTHVATLQVGDNFASYPWQPIVSNGVRETILGGDTQTYINIARAQQEIGAYFLRKLVDTPDINGEPLINTTVFAQTNCMGNAQTFNPKGSPWLLATNLDGFNTTRNAVAGTSEDFCAAMALGMGIPENMIDITGNPDAAALLR